MPARFVKRAKSESEKEDAEFEGVRISADSIQAFWMKRFHDGRAVDFLSTRFMNWWKLELIEGKEKGKETKTKKGKPIVLARFDITRSVSCSTDDWGGASASIVPAFRCGLVNASCEE